MIFNFKASMLVAVLACADKARECKAMIGSHNPIYQDMCTRLCDIMVKDQRCNLTTSGVQLANCVVSNYDYCESRVHGTLAPTPLPRAPIEDKIEECKASIIASEESFQDVCAQLCDHVGADDRCGVITTGVQLANCVANNYPSCHFSNAHADNCRTKIGTNRTPEYEFSLMCQNNCNAAAGDPKCLPVTSGTQLASCVSQLFSYCVPKN